MQHFKQPYTVEGVILHRDKDQLKFEVDNKDNEMITIYVGNSAKKDCINHVLIKTTKSTFEVTLPAEKMPYYFLMKKNNQVSSIFSERVLDLEGAINVRDMGGYETDDGKVTKWGLLFRGDQLSKLNVGDIQLLERLKIRTIIDFRSNHEIELHPNKQIKTVKQVFQCDPKSILSEAAGEAVDLQDENAKLVKALENEVVAKELANGKGIQVLGNYKKLVDSLDSQQAYKKMMKVYATPEYMPSLQHCRGGKDRTGFGSALLLLLLGVKKEEILKDYMITQEIRKERNDFKMKQYQELTTNQDHLDYLASLIETRPEFILESINQIERVYGNVLSFANQVLDLDEKSIHILREAYLENK